MEAQVILPLTRQWQRFEAAFEDWHAVEAEARQLGAKRAAWEKRSDKELRAQEKALREERSWLFKQRDEQEAKGQALGEADQRRIQEVATDLCLVDLERVLRGYESGAWKNRSEPERAREKAFLEVVVVFETALAGAQWERLEQIQKSWPVLPPTQVEGLDLLTADPKRLEQVLGPLLEKRQAREAGLARARKLRELAEVYRLQRRLVELAYLQRERALDESTSLASLYAERMPDTGRLEEALLRAERSLAQAREDILRTWVGYEIARLDLYGDLGRTPPKPGER
jgi:hypothetical protein